MALFAIAMYRKGEKTASEQTGLDLDTRNGHPLLRRCGACWVLPILYLAVNLWTHGTFVTAMHGHLAFWGAYGMLVLGMITYAMPLMTGRKMYTKPGANYAFWLSNIGMIGMTTAFAAVGVTQVYLERKVGMEFMDAQQAMRSPLPHSYWGCQHLFVGDCLVCHQIFSNTASPQMRHLETA